MARRFLPLQTPARFAIALATGLSTVAVHGALEGPAFAQHATERVTATATFAPRASLQISSQVLQFEVIDATIPSVATVEFAAGARTRAGGEVLLVVEVATGAAPIPGELTIDGGTDGTSAGQVGQGTPTVAGRWAGGGLRSGRVTFRLLAPPGVYSVPVRFRLSAP